MKRHCSFPHRHAGQVNLAALAFLAIVAFFLLAEHRAHLFGALPLLLLFACPLLHFFMHGGHGSHGEHKQPPADKGEQP